MMKKYILGTGVAVVAIVLVISLFSNNSSHADGVLNHKEVKELVSSQYPGEIIELELDRENNRLFYELEVVNNEYVYEIKVDAKTGEILRLKEGRMLTQDIVDENNVAQEDDNNDKAEESKTAVVTKEQPKNTTQSKTTTKTETNKETNKTVTKSGPKQQVKQTSQQAQAPKKTEQKAQQPTQKQEQKQEQKRTIISREQAIQIALSEFSGVVEDVELDDDDDYGGRLVYEIEIERGDEEAEIIIDAMTGEVLLIEIDD